MLKLTESFVKVVMHYKLILVKEPTKAEFSSSHCCILGWSCWDVLLRVHIPVTTADLDYWIEHNYWTYIINTTPRVLQIFYSFIFNYCFIQINATVDLEPIPGALRVRWDYTLVKCRVFYNGVAKRVLSKILIRINCSQIHALFCLCTAMLQDPLKFLGFCPSLCLHTTEECALHPVIVGQTLRCSAAITTTHADSASQISVAVLVELEQCFGEFSSFKDSSCVKNTSYPGHMSYRWSLKADWQQN